MANSRNKDFSAASRALTAPPVMPRQPIQQQQARAPQRNVQADLGMMPTGGGYSQVPTSNNWARFSHGNNWARFSSANDHARFG